MELITIFKKYHLNALLLNQQQISLLGKLAIVDKNFQIFPTYFSISLQLFLLTYRLTCCAHRYR